MGVVSINLEMDVEQWYRGIPKKSREPYHEGRSKVVNRLLRKHIQAQLGDGEAKIVEDLSSKELLWCAITKKKQSQWNEVEWRRALLLRDTLLELIE